MKTIKFPYVQLTVALIVKFLRYILTYQFNDYIQEIATVWHKSAHQLNEQLFIFYIIVTARQGISYNNHYYF